MRWLALAAPPNVLVVLAISIARVTNRSRWVVAINAAVCVITLALALAACPFPGWPQEVKSACPLLERTSLRMKEGTVPIASISNAVLFEAGLAIDADGAPNAYGPHDKGLDLTAHARGRKGWAGVLADERGQPAQRLELHELAVGACRCGGRIHADQRTGVCHVQGKCASAPLGSATQQGGESDRNVTRQCTSA
jgi:hypothetical protein